MKAKFLKIFQKHYKIRILSNKNLDERFEKRFNLFLQNPSNPFLRDHALMGTIKGLRSFSITGDIQVTYYIEDETAYFVDIGTHNQIY